MRILHLTLKKKWFDMILSGEKKEEYREIKPYWIKRLSKQYDIIRFRNGYSSDAPTMDIMFLGVKVGVNKTEWSDASPKQCYVLSLGNILSQR